LEVVRDPRYDRDKLDVYGVFGKSFRTALTRASALVYLRLAYGVLDLEVMERLHESAPNLQEPDSFYITLNTVENELMVDNENGELHLKNISNGNIFVNSTANNLKSLTFSSAMVDLHLFPF
jgi:hypothetical protein